MKNVIFWNDERAEPLLDHSKRVYWPLKSVGMYSGGDGGAVTLVPTDWLSFAPVVEVYLVDVVLTGEPPLRIGRRLKLGLCSRTTARQRRSETRKAAERLAREAVQPHQDIDLDWIQVATFDRSPSATPEPVRNLAPSEHTFRLPYRVTSSFKGAT